MDIQEITQRVEADSVVIRQIMANIEKVIVGQRYLIERMIIGLLCDGLTVEQGQGPEGKPEGGVDGAGRCGARPPPPWPDRGSSSGKAPFRQPIFFRRTRLRLCSGS